MIYRLIIYFSLTLASCSLNRGKCLSIHSLQSNDALKQYVRTKQIKGHIGSNFYKETKTDSLVYLSVLTPFEQNYPIDSIYYFYQNDSNYKILAQSEFEKGLLYLEVDKNGNHNRYYTFGGYVLGVNNVQIDEKKNSLQLTFETDIWASTMPDTVRQFIKIESNKNSINFKIWNKFDKKDVWQLVIPD